MNEWKPIDSAPLDGTYMLLWNNHHGSIAIGAWLPYGDASYPFVWQSRYGDSLVRPWKQDPNFTHWMEAPLGPCVPPLEAETPIDEDAAYFAYQEEYQAFVDKTVAAGP